MKTYVYCIGCKSRGNVKIGVSSNPDKRLKQLQTGSSEKMIIRARLPFGSRKEAMAWESWFHRQYAIHHIRGEWFRPHAWLEMSGLIKRARGGMTLNQLFQEARDKMAESRNQTTTTARN